MSEQGKHRLLPMITESVVIAVLLASFIYGAVSTSTSMGACAPVEAEEEEGDGDDTGGGEVVAGNSGNAGTACALTKGATGLTVSPVDPYLHVLEKALSSKHYIRVMIAVDTTRLATLSRSVRRCTQSDNKHMTKLVAKRERFSLRTASGIPYARSHNRFYDTSEPDIALDNVKYVVGMIVCTSN